MGMLNNYEMVIFVPEPVPPTNLSIEVLPYLAGHVIAYNYSSENSDETNFEIKLCEGGDTCDKLITSLNDTEVSKSSQRRGYIDLDVSLAPGQYHLSIRSMAFGKYSDYVTSNFSVGKYIMRSIQ